MPTGYLNQNSITSSVYVGWDGLTPPTLPIPPWFAVSGTAGVDFSLAAIFASVMLQAGAASNFNVNDTDYPVLNTQQIAGFRIGCWMAVHTLGTESFAALDAKNGSVPHRLGLLVNGGSSQFQGALNASPTITVNIVPVLSLDKWYFVALEVFNNVVTWYADLTGISTVLTPPPDQSENVTIYNQYAATANLGTLYPCIACFSGGAKLLHLRLTFFTAPQIAAAVPGGEGYPIPLAPYQRYKAVRAAVDRYNNLQLGP